MPNNKDKYKFVGKLYQELLSKGFTLQPSDYVDIFSLLENEDDFEKIKFQLATIICKNAKEQIGFYKIFDELFKEEKESTSTSTTTTTWYKKLFSYLKKHKYKWLTFSFLMLSFILLFIFRDEIKEWFYPKPIDYSQITVYDIALNDDIDSNTHSFNSYAFFNEDNKQLIKENFRINWIIDDTIKRDTSDFEYRFVDLKCHHFEVKIQSDKNDIDTVIKGTFISKPKMIFQDGINRKDIDNQYSNKERNYKGDTIFFSFYTNDVFQDSAFFCVASLY